MRIVWYRIDDSLNIFSTSTLYILHRADVAWISWWKYGKSIHDSEYSHWKCPQTIWYKHKCTIVFCSIKSQSCRKYYSWLSTESFSFVSRIFVFSLFLIPIFFAIILLSSHPKRVRKQNIFAVTNPHTFSSELDQKPKTENHI